MKIEVLFPEICNLYGELGNIKFLKKSYPEAEITETCLTDEPLFTEEVPTLIYMGTMSEKSQAIVTEKLMKHRKKISELINSGANFLITGNALEIFGKGIYDGDGLVQKCLGIFDFKTKRDMMNRYNSLYLGTFENMKIVGFKSQFAHSYWDSGAKHLFFTERGPGLNPEIKEEGIREKNFMATYVTGPLLILNPPFAKYILANCGASEKLAFEKTAMDAYNARVKEYSDMGTGFYY